MIAQIVDYSVVRFTDLIGFGRSIPSDKSLGYFRIVR